MCYTAAMSLAPKLMTADEFLIWRQSQEGTWEFVDGAPRPKFRTPSKLMAGGTRNHARVARNSLTALSARLSDGPCEAYGSDMALRNVRGGLRQPDVVVDCSAGRGGDFVVDLPTVVIEVLSPSTRGFAVKSEEYKALPSLLHLVLLEADLALGLVWTRAGDGWEPKQVEGLDDELRLAGIGVALPMADVYRRVELAEDVA